MKKSNFIVIILLSMAVCSFVGCHAVSNSKVENESSKIKNLTEEEIVFSEQLVPISDAENLTEENIYYKRITDNGRACFQVKKSSDNECLTIPMDNTVIYTTQENENKIEKVTFSYEKEKEIVKVEQYRLYLNNTM